MKRSWPVLLTLGLFLGMLLAVPWATSGPIQQQVGINTVDSSTGRWSSSCSPLIDADGVGTNDLAPFQCNVTDVQSLLWISRGTGASLWDRLRSANIGDAAPSTGLLAAQGFGFGGANFDRLRTVEGTGSSTTGLGLAASGKYLQHTSAPVAWVPAGTPTFVGSLSTGSGLQAVGSYIFDNTNFPRQRSASASTLTETVSAGTALTAPLSTWSATNTPLANTQATASRAAGAAGVRHVATSITACFSGTAVAAPVQVNLRDGATGAGTILRSWLLGIDAVNVSRCVDLSSLAMIGTAATAMTIEFAAAGGASTNETVTLTGYSVQ